MKCLIMFMVLTGCAFLPDCKERCYVSDTLAIDLNEALTTTSEATP